MKTEPGGHNFTRDDVMYAVDLFLRDQNGAFYTEGICLLHDRWTKCVNIGGENDSFYLRPRTNQLPLVSHMKNYIC